jgi:hypothetical protein
MNGQAPGRRSRTKIAAMAALPVVGSGGVIVATASPAAAAVMETRQHTFTDFEGFNHTCTIQVVREYPYAGDGQVGRGATTVPSQTDPLCTDGAIAYIGAHYFDPDGLEVTTELNSDGLSTARRYAPVGSQFKTIHEVDFSGTDCAVNCLAHFERTK